MRTTIRTWTLLGVFAAFAPGTLTAQNVPPPIRGTVALEGTMTKFYRGLNELVVTTVDGAQHVYHFTKKLVVHGERGGGPNALEGLRPGTRVVVHYRIDVAGESVEEIDSLADEGLKVTEGVVTRLDRKRQEIVLTLADGTTETLRLTERAATESDGTIDAGQPTKVVVYYSDEAGHKVAHYFKKAQ